jgi:hypothetical protein
MRLGSFGGLADVTEVGGEASGRPPCGAFCEALAPSGEEHRCFGQLTYSCEP